MVLGNRPLHAQFVQGTKGYVKVSFTRSSSRTTILSSMQTDPTLLTNNPQILLDVHVESVCTPCCMLLGVLTQSLKLVKLFANGRNIVGQQLPTLLA